MKFLSSDLVEFAQTALEGLGDARALSIEILLRHGEYEQIATMRCDHNDFLDAQSYSIANAATALLRKCRDLPTTIDLRRKAFEKWEAGEKECYKSNERLNRYLPQHAASHDIDPVIAEFFRDVKALVTQWIGHKPPDSVSPRFGPGATFSDSAACSTVPAKMTSVPTITHEAMWFLPQWLETAWGRCCAQASRSPLFIKGNRFSTARKDATTDRAIGTEPSINVAYQLAYGRVLRDRFKGGIRVPYDQGIIPRVVQKKRVGLDLNQGQLIHRHLACEASLTGRRATLDATNASDTVCRVLVELSTPEAWHEVLAMLRSPFTEVDGNWVKLEKFSSMGNGYTFELESVIFAALCCVASRAAGYPGVIGEDVFVYGDDMIVDVGAVETVTAVLAFCGITLNLKKSFKDGPFRESCGGDYYSGMPVRPFYIKEEPHGPEDWIRLANGLTRLSWELGVIREGDLGDRINWDPSARPDGFGPSKAHVYKAWRFAVNQLPTRIRHCRGPSGLGDIVINDGMTKWSVSDKGPHSRARGIRWIRAYAPVTHRKVMYEEFSDDVVLACAVYGLGWGNGGVTPRDSVLGYGLVWVPYS